MYKELLPNSIIGGRYEIVHEIARGGMGIVYKAIDLQLEMPVAIKVLTADLLSNPGALADLKSEAKASMMLSHPNIVRLHNFDSVKNINFLIMELLPGPTLSALLTRKKRFSVKETVSYATQICAGLDYAHKNKVIHRDIKPSNIMFAQDSTLKIADFGIAKIAHDALAQITKDTVSGTLVYMAPERLKGEMDTGRSDLYSVGIMLYEFLNGKPPFFTGAIEFQILHSDPPPLTGVPEALSKIIFKAIAKSPDERWKTADEMGRALDRRSLIPRHTPSEVATDRRRRPKEFQGLPPIKSATFRKKKKKQTSWIAGGGLMLILSMMGAGLLIRSKLEESKPAFEKNDPRIEEIKKLISTADVLVVKRRLVRPEGNNALEVYRKVLKLDPADFYARQKIVWIEEKHLDWAVKAFNTDDYTEAKQYLLDALKVNPGNAKTKERLREVYRVIAAAKPKKSIAQISREKIIEKIAQKKELHKLAALQKEKEEYRKKQSLKAEKIKLQAAKKREEKKKAQEKLKRLFTGMVFIGKGKFIMGSSEKNIKDYLKMFPETTDQPNWYKRMFGDEQKNNRAREVYLDAFWIDRHEVTNRQYQEFVTANPRWNKDNISPKYHDGNYLKHWNGGHPPLDKDDHPVVYVSWYAAKAYANWKKKRLPTESEWEKTAQGEKSALWPWGDEWNSAFLNSSESNFQGTVPVGSFPDGASPHKVLDLAGNVWEWCRDWYGRFSYLTAPAKNPRGALKGSSKVVRGGSWGSYKNNTRSANRYNVPPTFCGYSIGFRCAKNPLAEDG